MLLFLWPDAMSEKQNFSVKIYKFPTNSAFRVQMQTPKLEIQDLYPTWQAVPRTKISNPYEPTNWATQGISKMQNNIIAFLIISENI